MAAVTFSQTFFAPGGGVAASCKAYVYVRGTTTPKQSFTSVDLSTPTTNPVIGSSVGVLQFYLDGDEDCSLIIKTSDDATTLMQVDYVANGGFFSIISYTIENVQFAEFLFTGDGAETEYTLPDVLAPSVHSLWVTINGIYQPVGTYSIVRDATDTHVTLATAPANGAEISIRLMALQGQAGDSAYQIAVNNGFVGTEPEWLETLIGTSSRDEQVFSGDGSDLTFVFTGMVIIDKLNITIFVDGIIQRESDYSLSNNGTDTTITFTSAPPLGTDNIVMRGAVLTGSGGAAVDSVNGQIGVVVLDADDIDDTSTTNKFATASELSKLAGIEAAADVTDATNVAAAGAVMTSGAQTVAGVKTFSSAPIIPDEAYGVGWNGSLEPPTKNAVYDKIETLGGGGSGDVVGPASSTTNHVAGFADTTGKLIKALTAAQIRGAAALDTIDSPQFTAVNIGAATDTTLTRVSAGVIAVEGIEITTNTQTQTLTNKTLTTPAINGGTVTPSATPAATEPGYLGAPQRSISAADTFVMSDAGKHLYHPAADTTARVWTIPANASVAYPIGTVIGIVNENAAGVITLAITSDTLRWGSLTGSRSLAANSTATLLKVTSTLWRLTGDGIT